MPNVALFLVAGISVPLRNGVAPNDLVVHAEATPLRAKTVTFSDGGTFPVETAGVFRLLPGNQTYTAVRDALKVGFRSIDTAQLYFNEASVGKAIRDSGIPRSEIFVTTKMSRAFLGLPTDYEQTLETLTSSLSKLGMDYVDMYLLHSPKDTEEHIKEQWHALIYAKEQGLVRHIGVSDFLVPQLKWLDGAAEPPVVLQIEMSPFLSKEREPEVKWCHDHSMVLEPWGALLTGAKMDDPTLKSVAASSGHSVADVLIQWSLQSGYTPLITSTNVDHLTDDLEVATSESTWVLTAAEMAKLNALGAHPFFSNGVDIAGATSP